MVDSACALVLPVYSGKGGQVVGHLRIVPEFAGAALAGLAAGVALECVPIGGGGEVLGLSVELPAGGLGALPPFRGGENESSRAGG